MRAATDGARIGGRPAAALVSSPSLPSPSIGESEHRPAARLRRTPPGPDALRAVAGAILAGGCYLLARGDSPGPVQTNLFRLINELPGGAAAAFVGLTQLGSLGAVLVAAAIAAARRRLVLSRCLLAAGGGAWALAKLSQMAAHLEPPEVVVPHVVLRGATAASAGFPAVHAAVAAAMATVLGAHLSRSARRLAWIGVGGVGLARIYVGAHLPVDVVGGIGIGWAAGAAAIIVLGLRRGRPAVDAIEAQLATLLSTPLKQISPTNGGWAWDVTAGDGRRVHVRALGSGEADGQRWVVSIGRLLAFRELTDPTLAPRHRAEHEGLLAMLARQAGVRTPRVVGLLDLDEGACLTVRDWIEGTPLSEDAVGTISDNFLDALWQQIAMLHAHGLTHGALRADHVIVGTDGLPALIGMVGHAHGRIDDGRRRDLAEVLVASAVVAGPERAVAAARRAVGRRALGELVVDMHVLNLSVPSRRAVRAYPDLLERLRAAMADSAGIAVPSLPGPSRVAARNMMPVVVGGAALYALLPRLSRSGRAFQLLRGASWPWLAATGAAAILTYAMAAVTLRAAAGAPLPPGQTFAVQLAAAFTNRLSPAGLGGMATNVRYLESNGAERPSAMASVALMSATGLVVHAAGLAVALGLVGTRGPVLRQPDATDDLVVVVVVVVASSAIAGVLAWRSGLAPKVVDPMRAAARSLLIVMSTPRRATALLIGSAGVTVGYTLALASALRALGASLPLLQVTAVYLGASALAAAAPTPGGLGPLEAALVAGLTASGVAGAPAVAAVITYRLITYWLPVLPGAMVFRSLRRHRVI